MWNRKLHTSEKCLDCFANGEMLWKSDCKTIFNACIHDLFFMFELLMVTSLRCSLGLKASWRLMLSTQNSPILHQTNVPGLNIITRLSVDSASQNFIFDMQYLCTQKCTANKMLLCWCFVFLLRLILRDDCSMCVYVCDAQHIAMKNLSSEQIVSEKVVPLFFSFCVVKQR